MTPDPTRGLLAALFIFLAGCQTLAPPLPTQAPTATEVKVPFHPQEKYQCGPASLAMMLGWAGTPAAPEALVSEVWLPERQGSLLLELRAAARARGLLVYPVNSPEALFAELDRGHPVLVLQNLAFSFWPRWHFAVAIGYRDGGRDVILHSGTEAARPSAWNRFLRTWARADYQGFVALPVGEVPATAQPLALARALQDLSGTAGNGAAVPHWQAAVEHFPEAWLLRFGLGNAQWSAGDRNTALEQWQKAVSLNPRAASAWNNLAEGLLQSGCHEQARTAVQKAYQLAPEDAAIRDTRESIQAAGNENSACPVHLHQPVAQ
jgi:tetratricopeptide (TPR) repeat protein